MILKTLTATHFKGFKSATVELDKKLSLFIGDNGVGKSSLLRMAQLLLSQAVRCIVPTHGWLNLPSMEDGDYRQLTERRSDGKLTRRVLSGVSVCGTLESDNLLQAVLCCREGTKPTKDEIKTVADMFAAEESLPVFAFYGAQRGAIPKHINQKKKKAVDYMNIHSAYLDALNADASYQLFVDWFKREEEDEFRDVREDGEHGGRSAELEAVRSALIKLFSTGPVSYSAPRMMARGVGLVFTRHEKGRKDELMPFDLLSDGYRSMVALVADFARRLAIANREKGDALEGKGVLLIDEIDLHLHPKWQQRVVADLQRVFPNVQILATTHAPEVVGSVDSQHIFSLHISDDGELMLDKPEVQTIGMSSHELLPYIMEVSSGKNIEDYNRYMELLNAGDMESEEALKLRESLERFLGASHPRMDDILVAENRLEVRRLFAEAIEKKQ